MCDGKWITVRTRQPDLLDLPGRSGAFVMRVTVGGDFLSSRPGHQRSGLPDYWCGRMTRRTRRLAGIMVMPGLGCRLRGCGRCRAGTFHCEAAGGEWSVVCGERYAGGWPPPDAPRY